MANKALNGKTASQNIYILLKKIKEAGLLHLLEKQLAAPGYRATLKCYIKYLSEETSYTELPDDRVLFKGTSITNIDSKKKHFYEKLIVFVGENFPKAEDWYQECLAIINQVDALWMMDLKEAAEMRFIDVYQIFNPQNHFNYQNQYSYVLSKIAYYYSYFSARSFINAEEKHLKFLDKSFLPTIEQFEHNSKFSGVLDPKRTLPLLQQKEDGAIQFYNHLAVYFNQKGELRNELEMLQKEIDLLIEKYKKQGALHIHSIPVFHREEIQIKFPYEFLYAHYFLLRVREYYLLLRLNELDQAQNVLEQLYRTLSTVREQTEHYMVALYYFVSNELYKMKADLVFTGKPGKYQLNEPDFDFYQKQLENLPLAIELNQIIYEFISNNSYKFDRVLKHISALRDKNAKAGQISFELFVIEAIILYETRDFSEAEDRISAAKRHSKTKNLDKHPFFLAFCRFFIKLLKQTSQQRYGELFEQAYVELNQLKTVDNSFFNFLFYWVQKHVSHVFLENLTRQESFSDPKEIAKLQKIKAGDEEITVVPPSIRRKWK